MESTDSYDCIDNVCPTFCVVKAVLFALLALFVVYFPLGDPDVLCNGANKAQNQKLPTSLLCDVYMMTVKLFNKTKEVAGLLLQKTRDLLYEAKLKFYSLLERLDSNDLHQSVCCCGSMDKTDETIEKRQGCKCSRRCCRNKIQTNL